MEDVDEEGGDEGRATLPEVMRFLRFSSRSCPSFFSLFFSAVRIGKCWIQRGEEGERRGEGDGEGRGGEREAIKTKTYTGLNRYMYICSLCHAQKKQPASSNPPH